MSKSKRHRPPMTEAEWDEACARLTSAIERAQAAGREVDEIEIEYDALAERLIADVLRPMGKKKRIALIERLYLEETCGEAH